MPWINMCRLTVADVNGVTPLRPFCRCKLHRLHHHHHCRLHRPRRPPPGGSSSRGTACPRCPAHSRTATAPATRGSASSRAAGRLATRGVSWPRRPRVSSTPAAPRLPTRRPYSLFYLSAPCTCVQWGTIDVVYVIAAVPGWHSGDQVHRFTKIAVPLFGTLLYCV